MDAPLPPPDLPAHHQSVDPRVVEQHRARVQSARHPQDGPPSHGPGHKPDADPGDPKDQPPHTHGKPELTERKTVVGKKFEEANQGKVKKQDLPDVHKLKHESFAPKRQSANRPRREGRN